ncbi:HigA family addiction module antitoxin [Aerobium aerolatum]|uniref:Addiction module antidote protein, HigA family n=1 Tax=Aquamicrobium aerolatum DSM 21857 TaxID=1121003 RepID=A0A1I3STX3_9HYPH|nr:HigA family addiction module antitoxin [Aquamicrobium aerolatum]SFJ62245.1 addiction module antidote protein, HigA family [Aquamicrobium aerolatum DSM 21857]
MAKFGEAALTRPGHPGPYIRAQVLDRFDLSVTDAAEAVGITRAAFSAFLNGRASLSADMALRIEKAFAISMAQLMHMQCDYDIAQAQAREGEISVPRFIPSQRPPNQPGLFEQKGDRK